MARRRTIDDLSVAELRRLLVEKERKEREARINHFMETGRVVRVNISEPPLDGAKTEEEIFLEEENPQKKRTRNSGLDRFLFAIEILAVIALGFVLYNGVNVLRNLNQEVARAIVQPTIEPTPLITAIILPSGHTPPNSPGGVQPNDAEIPEHLRPLVQSLANLPLPTSGPNQAVRIQIPAIQVDAPVVQGDGWEQLKKGVGQHIGSANPGEPSNLVLSAHNDVFGEIFRNLDQLKAGDTVVLYTSQQSFTYTVENTMIVEPTQVEVMAPTSDGVVTLISCYPYMVSNKRIVVIASLEQ
jgi:sortase A